MSAGTKTNHYIAPCANPNAIDGYTLEYAIKRTRKAPHRLPSGWRWLKVGEYTMVGDVACDARIPPVRILSGGDCVTSSHHPIRRRAQRTGLDDGPPLPSQRALDRAYAKIMKNELRTDAHRINWLESKKYFQVGINSRGGRWVYEVRFNDNTLKRFFGGSLRAAIDSGMDAENAGSFAG